MCILCVCLIPSPSYGASIYLSNDAFGIFYTLIDFGIFHTYTELSILQRKNGAIIYFSTQRGAGAELCEKFRRKNEDKDLMKSINFRRKGCNIISCYIEIRFNLYTGKNVVLYIAQTQMCCLQHIDLKEHIAMMYLFVFWLTNHFVLQ